MVVYVVESKIPEFDVGIDLSLESIPELPFSVPEFD